MSSTQVVITSEKRGPIINIITWILLVVTFLATFVKVFSKWVLVRKLQHDDAYMIATMVQHIQPWGFTIPECQVIMLIRR